MKHVFDDINYLREAVNLASIAYKPENRDDYEVIVNFHKFNITKADYREIFANDTQFKKNVYKAARKVVKKYPDLSGYFVHAHDVGEETANLWSKLRIDSIEDLDENNFRDAIKSAIYFASGEGVEDNEILKNPDDYSDGDIVKMILDLEAEGFETLNMINNFINAASMLGSVKELLIELRTLIMEHIHLVKDSYDKMVEYYRSIDKEDFFGYKLLEMSSMAKRGHLKVYVDLILSNQLSARFIVNGFTDEKDYDVFVGVGYLFEKVQSYQIEKVETGVEIKEQIKELSDDTRLKILKLLSVRAYYGKELADELGLSAATISHHLERLTSKNLAIWELDGRRAFINLNKNAIRRIGQFFLDLAGDEDDKEN